MTHLIRISSLAFVAAAALQLSSVSGASAQQATAQPGVRHYRTTSPNIGPDAWFRNQSAARAAHPITQGGTTGGTVNPGLTGDHMQHGYNG